jgi:glycerophosphoryl diester phosphodiesterase
VTPTVIAHRGASGHRPEHTRAAYELAFRLGADSIELDLLATRDGAIVCRHDVELSRTTDIAARPRFAHLRRTLDVDGVVQTGWFVHDLTLAELRRLRCRERWPRRRPGSAEYNGRESVPTLEEVLELVDAESARQGRRLGIHAELKSPAHLAAQGLALPDLVAGVDRPGITWLSFDEDALRALDPGRRTVQLFDSSPTSRELSRAAEHASAVGVQRRAVLRRDGAGRVAGPTKLVAKARKRDLGVLVWTHRAENRHLPKALRIGDNPNAHGNAAREAELLYEAGIDGLITDFPEIAHRVRAELPGLAAAQ